MNIIKKILIEGLDDFFKPRKIDERNKPLYKEGDVVYCLGFSASFKVKKQISPEEAAEHMAFIPPNTQDDNWYLIEEQHWAINEKPISLAAIEENLSTEPIKYDPWDGEP